MKRRSFMQKTSAAALLTAIAPASGLFGSQTSPIRKDSHICIFSKHLHWLGYSEMARLVSEIGFTGIDLTVRPNGHVLPENVKRDLPRAVQQIRDAGLEVPMITTGITDPGDPLTRDILETAGKLGIRLYRPGWYKYSPGVKVMDAVERARKQLTRLQVINKANNIAASYQNHAGLYMGSSGWDLLKMIDGLDPAWTGVQFDIRHAMVEGPETWPVFLEILAPYINSLDIKDFTWQLNHDTAELLDVPLGQGLVPFDTYLLKLKELGVRADISIHYEYALGGAEHGDTELGISEEAFRQKVGADLAYLKGKVAQN
ncbi:MAG: sugar phosphate isomerase/epimerase family protein [Bacteroidota bacterium]